MTNHDIIPDYYIERKKRRERIVSNLVIAISILFLLFLLFGCNRKEAWASEIDLKIIAQIESSNNPNAVSFAGAKNGRGLYQISEICLKDYNQQNNAKISPTMLFNPKVNEMVAKWYLGARIPQLLRNKGISVTTANVIWAYNAGIGKLIKGVMPQETANYLKKYKRLSNA